MAAKAQTADEVAEAGDGEAAPTKKKFALPSMKIMIMAGAGVLMLAGGWFGYSKFFGHKDEAKEKVAVVKPATFVDMPDVLVNLSNPNGERTQYLKVKVVLELPDAEMVGKIQPLMPRVMDQFQTFLRELRPSDLDGSAGLYRLREELTRRVNAAVSPNRINAVLFKEIVVQ
jgi:flagellar FliL protein